MWVNGPFACGLWSDWKIFKEGGLLFNLDPNERVEADDGYDNGDPEYVKSRSGIFHDNDTVRNTVRARHETVNKRFKQFGAMSKVFRHGPAKHSIIFDSVATLTQLSFNRGETLFQNGRVVGPCFKIKQ